MIDESRLRVHLLEKLAEAAAGVRDLYPADMGEARGDVLRTAFVHAVDDWRNFDKLVGEVTGTAIKHDAEDDWRQEAHQLGVTALSLSRRALVNVVIGDCVAHGRLTNFEWEPECEQCHRVWMVRKAILAITEWEQYILNVSITQFLGRARNPGHGQGETGVGSGSM